ncbi:Pre-mRNA-splicing factor of RES complex-domain-containing protein [Lasiosphaeris hirsuta]|uniref:Pre-mRNA-splicing factor of RES complex-domain-containing protein n=1 Tax=Lasiosphaeris hirsuta TaxID=260670 RepID=A0AA40AFJ6_9PEZI|nr:Pre-mRNA-splicing factor of RES complex-domain-containing protein [Lasiosphaeris hirsuta]
MPSDKASYLAAHYLTADTKPSKKRKRKHASIADGLLIKDDDDAWADPSSRRDGDGADTDGPITVAGTSAEFRRSKKSAWKTVGAPIPLDTKDARDAAADADAILALAAAEQAAAAREADGDIDDPSATVTTTTTVPQMADGTHAGLQSAAALTAQLRVRQEAERAELVRLKAEQLKQGAGAPEAEPEIVLRDATGRRVDVSMRRAEMRRAAIDAEKAEEARKRALRGDVQIAEAAARREALEDAALMPLARGRDDEGMNAEMRAQQRWNDPMAQFLGDGDERGPKGKRKGAGRKPVYKGAAPPNRYGIRPGYRWDGVDRGNGFEAERFKAINRMERNKTLDYAWQMDE